MKHTAKYQKYYWLLFHSKSKTDLYHIYNTIILNDLMGLSVPEIAMLNDIYHAFNKIFDDVNK